MKKEDFIRKINDMLPVTSEDTSQVMWRLPVIKFVNDVTRMGLKFAKDKVDAALSDKSINKGVLIYNSLEEDYKKVVKHYSEQ